MLADRHGNPDLESGNRWWGSQRHQATNPAAVGWESYRQQRGRRFACPLFPWNGRRVRICLDATEENPNNPEYCGSVLKIHKGLRAALKAAATVAWRGPSGLLHTHQYAATSLPDRVHLEGQEEGESLKRGINLCLSAPSTVQSGSVTECPLETKGLTLETSGPATVPKNVMQSLPSSCDTCKQDSIVHLPSGLSEYLLTK